MEELKKFLRDTVDLNDSMSSNRIFVVIKPGFENLLGELCQIFKDKGYKIEKIKTKRLLLSEAKELYKVHKKEDFYKSLCEYMSSGLTTAFILKKQSKNIFKEFAKLKDEIREKYGESDMRNVIHSSDSYKNMKNESSIYF
jgi:nucleoside-diphosphate kinase